MAKQAKRNYNKADTLMLQQAAVIYSLLFGTDGTDGDLPAFTTEFPEFTAIWLAAFLTAIDAADDTPGDDEVVTDQQLATLEVDTIMALARKRMVRLYRYADLTYPNNPLARDIFGYQVFVKKRYNQTKLKEAMQVAYSKANAAPYNAALIAKGFIQTRIDELNTIAQSLETSDIIQEVKKTERPEITQDRIEKHNAVWGIWETISKASKVVYEDNYAKQQQYLLYPEAGNDSGSTTSGTLTSGENKVVFSGSVLQSASKFNASSPANPSGGGFWLFSAMTAADGYSGSGTYVSSGSDLSSLDWSNLGGEKPFVKVYNPNGFDVDYEVEVL
ncbi:MAG: hypothetical protein AB7G44_05150 [Bacteroidia bacterium]